MLKAPITCLILVFSACVQASQSVKISDIQSNQPQSPLLAKVVQIEAIVVADFQDGDFGTHGDLNGFFVQEESDDFDSDPTTSEGLFVFDGRKPKVDVSVGDRVSITGTVAEFGEATQLTKVSVTIVASEQLASTKLTEITLPTKNTLTSSNGRLIADLEAYEGMWVSFPQRLSVTEHFNLDRFGEIGLASGDRLYNFTQLNSPDESGYQKHLQDIAKRRVILDDGFSTQNPNTIRYPAPQLSTSNSVRLGDQIANLTGVLSFNSNQYRLLPTVEPKFTHSNRRVNKRDSIDGSLSVGFFNVQNFFNTLDAQGSEGCYRDDNGEAQFSTRNCRGADSPEEFERQLEKLVSALVSIDVDILGLAELENDYIEGENSSIATLVSAINKDPRERSCKQYNYINPGVRIGGDSIAVGLMYCEDTVEVKANSTIEILDDTVLNDIGLSELAPVFSGSRSNRAVLAASFTEKSSSQSLTIAVNHFKSKGSGCGEGDDSVSTGQGNCNQTRVNAAKALHTWLSGDPTGANDQDSIILGDLNAYAKEDPVTELESNGYTNLTHYEGAYSYVFAGQAGSLDYALANNALLPQVVAAKVLHINADEPDALDYNLDFGAEARLKVFDGSAPYRSSDHDPVVIGLDLKTYPDDASGSAASAGSLSFFVSLLATIVMIRRRNNKVD